MNTTEKSDNVRAVGRALDILRAFDTKDFELSAADLLKRVQLSRPTLYRLLYTLQEHEFLVSVGDPQRFRLGPAVARLSHVWTASLDLATVAQPIMAQLREQTGETVALFVPQLPMRVCIAELPSTQPLNFKRGVGYSEFITRGATGRAILAFSHIHADDLHTYAQQAGMNAEQLQASLEETKRNGFASSHNELIPGAVAVAVPFFDRTGAVAGSMGIFGPEVRLDKERLEQALIALKNQASRLSEVLGYAGHSH